MVEKFSPQLAHIMPCQHAERCGKKPVKGTDIFSSEWLVQNHPLGWISDLTTNTCTPANFVDQIKSSPATTRKHIEHCRSSHWIWLTSVTGNLAFPLRLGLCSHFPFPHFVLRPKLRKRNWSREYRQSVGGEGELGWRGRRRRERRESPVVDGDEREREVLGERTGGVFKR